MLRPFLRVEMARDPEDLRRLDGKNKIVDGMVWFTLQYLQYLEIAFGLCFTLTINLL